MACTTPLDWNCKCRVRPTDKAPTALPGGSLKDEPKDGLANNPGKSGSLFDLHKHPYTKGQGLPTCPECRRQGLVKGAKFLEYSDLLCERHRLAWEALKDKRKEQQKLADKIVKEWASTNIPTKGLSLRDDKFYVKQVVIQKSSIKDLLGHIADPTQKTLAMHIEEVLRICEPKKGKEFASLNPTSHNLRKKQERGAVGFAYYTFEVSGDKYQLDMEVRKGYDGYYEAPYSIRKIKKKNL